MAADLIPLTVPELGRLLRRHASARHVGIVNAIPTGQRRRHQGQQIVSCFRPTRRISQVNMAIHQLARSQVVGQGDAQKQPRIGHQPVIVEGNAAPGRNAPAGSSWRKAPAGCRCGAAVGDGKPMLAPYAVNDYSTGLMGAHAVALALHERNRTGQGQSVDSGLALTAGLLQSPYFLDYEGYRREDIEGVDSRGYSTRSRLYQARRPAGSTCTARALLSALNFREIHEDGDAIAGNTVERWMQTLRPLGVLVSPNLTTEHYRNDPGSAERRLSRNPRPSGLGQR